MELYIGNGLGWAALQKAFKFVPDFVWILYRDR